MSRFVYTLSIFLLCHVSGIFGHALAHPGNLLNNNFTAGIPQRIYFTILDYDNKFITTQNIQVYHNRLMHVVIESADWNLFWHFHPEDFGNITEMAANGSYWVEVTFPKSGSYVMTADYVYRTNECYSAYTFSVVGGDAQTAPTSPLANTTAIPAKSFTLSAGDVYQNAIHIDEIADNADYFFSVSFMDHDMSSIYPGQTCIMMTITITDAAGRPAVLVPYLDAPSHISIVHTGNKKVYHVHGMSNSDMASHNMTMMCDMHYGDMPSGGRQTVGSVLTAGFMPDVQGRFQAVIQMKSPMGENGMLIIGAFQFIVGEDVGVTNLTTGMTSMNMTSTMGTMGGMTEGSTTAAVPEPTTMNMPTMTMSDATTGSTSEEATSTTGPISNLEDSGNVKLSFGLGLMAACIMALL